MLEYVGQARIPSSLKEACLSLILSLQPSDADSLNLQYLDFIPYTIISPSYPNFGTPSILSSFGNLKDTWFSEFSALFASSLFKSLHRALSHELVSVLLAPIVLYCHPDLYCHLK